MPWVGEEGTHTVLGRSTMASSGLFHEPKLIRRGFRKYKRIPQGRAWCFTGEMWVSQVGWSSIYRGWNVKGLKRWRIKNGVGWNVK